MNKEKTKFIVSKVRKGMQFKTFISKNHNFVVKFPTTYLTILIHRIKQFVWHCKFKEVMIWLCDSKFVKEKQNQRRRLLNQLKGLRNNLYLLGNIKFQDTFEIYSKLFRRKNVLKGVVIQDKAVLLNKVLKKKKYLACCRLIDKFIGLNVKLWRLGIFEYVFNFTINNGVNEKGDVILIDIGELFIDDKDNAKEKIKERPWFNAWSYKSDLKNSRLKKYYTEEARKYFNIKNFEKNWKKDLK